MGKDFFINVSRYTGKFVTDNITSDTSLAPFSSEEVASMLSLMDPLMGKSFTDIDGRC